MTSSILRAAHGTGSEALLRVELTPLDELSAPVRVAEYATDTTDLPASPTTVGRPFQPGNAAAKNKRTALAKLGINLTNSDPRWRAQVKKAKRYADTRARELTAIHGSIGAGVHAALSSTALALAASRLLYEMFAETLDTKLLKQAAALDESHRHQELFAIGLAQREAESRAAITDDVGARRLAAMRARIGE